MSCFDIGKFLEALGSGIGMPFIFILEQCAYAYEISLVDVLCIFDVVTLFPMVCAVQPVTFKFFAQ